MNQQAQERLSALMDNEVSDFELRRAIDEVSADPEQLEQWRRYHLAQSIVSGDMERSTHVDQTIDLSGSIMAAIDAEPALNVSNDSAGDDDEKGSVKRDFWKPLASMAVAASVTAVVILGVQNFQEPGYSELADNRPDYNLPSTAVINKDLMQAQYGDRSMLSVDQGTEADIIRLSQGLSRYIDQHQSMLTGDSPQWQAAWVPDGYKALRHEVMPEAEVMLFSNGRQSVSVCIEDYGRQSVSEGVAQASGMIAVGKKQGGKFVTVVGDVPLVLAEKIADSIQIRNN